MILFSYLTDFSYFPLNLFSSKVARHSQNRSKMRTVIEDISCITMVIFCDGDNSYYIIFRIYFVCFWYLCYLCYTLAINNQDIINYYFYYFIFTIPYKINSFVFHVLVAWRAIVAVIIW
jgi:hypothetical protein